LTVVENMYKPRH